MKKIVLALFVLSALSIKAMAGTETDDIISSATVVSVICSSGTPIRIDDYMPASTTTVLYGGMPAVAINASTNTVLANRVKVDVENQSQSFDIFLGFDNRLSSVAWVGQGINQPSGWRVYGSTTPAHDNFKSFAAGPSLPIWCIAENSAGATGALVTVIQYAKP